jgi:hypothetical protein
MGGDVCSDSSSRYGVLLTDTVGRNYLNRKSLSVVSQYGFVYLNDSGIHEITSDSMRTVSQSMCHDDSIRLLFGFGVGGVDAAIRCLQILEDPQ